nr:hypothetical protein BaRGS_001112 [Batillaria attramentaria]
MMMVVVVVVAVVVVVVVVVVMMMMMMTTTTTTTTTMMMMIKEGVCLLKIPLRLKDVKFYVTKTWPGPNAKKEEDRTSSERR